MLIRSAEDECVEMVRRLLRLRGIGENSAWLREPPVRWSRLPGRCRPWANRVWGVWSVGPARIEGYSGRVFPNASVAASSSRVSQQPGLTRVVARAAFIAWQGPVPEDRDCLGAYRQELDKSDNIEGLRVSSRPVVFGRVRRSPGRTGWPRLFQAGANGPGDSPSGDLASFPYNIRVTVTWV